MPSSGSDLTHWVNVKPVSLDSRIVLSSDVVSLDITTGSHQVVEDQLTIEALGEEGQHLPPRDVTSLCFCAATGFKIKGNREGHYSIRKKLVNVSDPRSTAECKVAFLELLVLQNVSVQYRGHFLEAGDRYVLRHGAIVSNFVVLASGLKKSGGCLPKTKKIKKEVARHNGPATVTTRLRMEYVDIADAPDFPLLFEESRLPVDIIHSAPCCDLWLVRRMPKRTLTVTSIYKSAAMARKSYASYEFLRDRNGTENLSLLYPPLGPSDRYIDLNSRDLMLLSAYMTINHPNGAYEVDVRDLIVTLLSAFVTAVVGRFEGADIRFSSIGVLDTPARLVLLHPGYRSDITTAQSVQHSSSNYLGDENGDPTPETRSSIATTNLGASEDSWRLGQLIYYLFTGQEASFHFASEMTKNEVRSVYDAYMHRINIVLRSKTMSEEGLGVVRGLFACDPAERMSVFDVIRGGWLSRARNFYEFSRMDYADDDLIALGLSGVFRGVVRGEPDTTDGQIHDTVFIEDESSDEVDVSHSADDVGYEGSDEDANSSSPDDEVSENIAAYEEDAAPSFTGHLPWSTPQPSRPVVAHGSEVPTSDSSSGSDDAEATERDFRTNAVGEGSRVDPEPATPRERGSSPASAPNPSASHAIISVYLESLKDEVVGSLEGYVPGGTEASEGGDRSRTSTASSTTSMERIVLPPALPISSKRSRIYSSGEPLAGLQEDLGPQPTPKRRRQTDDLFSDLFRDGVDHSDLDWFAST